MKCVHAHTCPVENTSLKAWSGMLLSTDRSSEIEGTEVWAKGRAEGMKEGKTVGGSDGWTGR